MPEEMDWTPTEDAPDGNEDAPDGNEDPANEVPEVTSPTPTETTWSADSMREEGSSGSEEEASLQVMRNWLMNRPASIPLIPRRVRPRVMGWGSPEIEALRDAAFAMRPFALAAPAA